MLPTALTTTNSKNTGRKTRSKHQSIKRDENRQKQQQPQPPPPQTLSPTDPDSTEGNQNPTIEITKLNTLRPEVNYNGYTYLCDWATTIGTDMFFAKPDSSEPTRTKIAQQRSSTTTPAAKAAQLSITNGKESDSSLVGISRVKLVAKQVRKVAVAPNLNPHSKSDDRDRSIVAAQPSSSNAVETAGNADKSQLPSGNPQTQPSPSAPSPLATKSAVASSLSSTLKRRQQQESFLRRLVEIKRQRGDADADAVPMYGVGWEPLKKTAEPAEREMTDSVAGQNAVGENPENTDAIGGGDEGNIDSETGETRGENMDVAD